MQVLFPQRLWLPLEVHYLENLGRWVELAWVVFLCSCFPNSLLLCKKDQLGVFWKGVWVEPRTRLWVPGVPKSRPLSYAGRTLTCILFVRNVAFHIFVMHVFFSVWYKVQTLLKLRSLILGFRAYTSLLPRQATSERGSPVLFTKLVSFYT